MVYVALDGPDGCGKSTQAGLLAAFLQRQGRVVHHLREPGSTPVGEALRQLLLSPTTGELLPLSEALLFTAARAELVARVVAPALARGEDVVAERCYVSTLAYQALAHPGAVAFDWVLDLTRRAHGACLPDRVFVLDVDLATAVQRRRSRERDRFEARGDDFHERVRSAYRTVAEHLSEVELIDARCGIETVQQELQRRCTALLGARALR